MIAVESVSIRHFRGIKELDLELGGKNFGIFGPNGTGKSGVVDALEFCLTGQVTRLSGPGSEDLSVAKHGPHVDARYDPAKAVVTIKGRLPNIKDVVTITRSVNSPSKVSLLPDTDATRAAVAEMKGHPEIALSRREIAKYVMTPAGRRATDVQTLLRLDRLDKIRKAFTTAANHAGTAAEAAVRNRDEAKKALKDGLLVETLNKANALEAINKRRTVLGLDPMSSFDASSPKDGLVGQSHDAAQSKVVKATALKETEELVTVAKAEGAAVKQQRETAHAALSKLAEDAAKFRAIQQRALVESGLELVDGDSCPLCDEPWTQEDLRAHLQAKLATATEAQATIDALNAVLAPVRATLSDRIARQEKAKGYAKALKLADSEAASVAEVTRLKAQLPILSDALDNLTTLKAAIAILADPMVVPNAERLKHVGVLKSAIAALPEKSEEDKAREFLILADERYSVFVRRKLEAEVAEKRATVARRTRDLFEECADAALVEIYESVSKDFESFYKMLNEGDEDAFSGVLTPAPARLSLDVDFYGRGKFPPGAFHSEGHQDGMGLCLYLALMKQTMGDKFRFCVLDDVLMSVDAGHRRQVCRLLMTEFGETQFILTTHDRVWLHYMRSENLISRSQTFNGWSVDTGPMVFHHKDVWGEIDKALTEGDVPTAAGRLRRYLEFVGHFMSDGVRAPVPFRGDAKYTLNDLLPPALKAVKTHLAEAKKAATSWGKTAVAAQATSDLDAFNAAVKASKAEEWAINPSVHYTEWENFQPAEFKTIVGAFHDVASALRCSTCDTFLHLAGSGPASETLRCQCGTKTYDLVSKKGG